MSKESRVILGMDFFFRNQEEANRTLRAFFDILGAETNIVLGVVRGVQKENDESRQITESFLNDRKNENWAGVYLYPWEIDNDKLLEDWPPDLPMPYYNRFSYGGIVNRLLLLGKIAGCDYLIRIDPGTRPPYYFPQLVNYHITQLVEKKAKVVSGQYTDRLGIRDEFVSEDRRASYYDFIKDYTGINPCLNMQVTAGAASTLSVMGPPVIPFDGDVGVWASDDGFFQMLFPAEARVIPESRIIHSKPSILRTQTVYAGRVANMVVLCELVKGSDERKAQIRAEEFLDNFPKYLNQQSVEGFNVDEAKKELSRCVKFIAVGYQKYQFLKERWQEVIEELSKRAQKYIGNYILTLNRKPQ